MSEPPPTSQDDLLEHDRDDRSSIPEAGLLGRIVEGGGMAFALAFVVSALILLFEIGMRYGLGSPTLWAHETSIFLCAVAFIYGGLYCTARDRHIRVVLVYDHLGPRLRRVFDVAISLTSMVAAGFFAFAAWLMVERAFWSPGGGLRLETTGSAWNPPTPALLKGMLFLAMVVLSVQFLVLAVNYARGGRRGAR